MARKIIDVPTTEKVTIINCDDCGDEIKEKYYCNRVPCHICGKDLCLKCVAHSKEWGDYPENYCKDCWEIGIPIKDAQRVLQAQIDALDDKWYEQGELARRLKQNG